MYDENNEPVMVVNFPSASVDDAELAISDDNCETTITENSVHFQDVSVFTTNQIQYDVPISNFCVTVELVVADILLLGNISAISEAMAVGTK